MNERKPNIVFLFSDQHNARVLGCYGDSTVYTPNLDQLAKSGVRCEHAYTQNPICTPSRMSFFTGQYPHNHGYYGLMGPDPVALPNMVRHLKEQGYRIGLIGKLHTPTQWLSSVCDERDTVLDVCFHEHEDHHNDYHRYLEGKGLLDQTEHPFLPEWKQRGGSGQGLDARPSKLQEQDTPEGWIASESVKFIEQAFRDDVPFFLFMSTNLPHQTYTPAQKFWDLYEGQGIPLPPNEKSELSERHPVAERVKAYYQTGPNGEPEWVVFEPKDFESARRRVLHGYYAAVSQVDDAIGQVMASLRELEIMSQTITLYSSDHGDFAGEHGMIEKAPGIGFRAITRIPLLWSWPGHLPEQKVIDQMVEAVDVFPTLCSLAGIPQPDGIDGMDMKGLLTGESSSWKPCAVTENVFSKTIRTQTYTYVHYLPEISGGRIHGELYCHNADPWELDNKFADPDYQQVIDEMRLLLLNWLIRTSRFNNVLPMPDREKADRLRISYSDVQPLIQKGAIRYL